MVESESQHPEALDRNLEEQAAAAVRQLFLDQDALGVPMEARHKVVASDGTVTFEEFAVDSGNYHLVTRMRSSIDDTLLIPRQVERLYVNADETGQSRGQIHFQDGRVSPFGRASYQDSHDSTKTERETTPYSLEMATLTMELVVGELKRRQAAGEQ
jgi:hypothetical protein